MTLRILKLAAPVFFAVVLLTGPANANPVIPLLFLSWMGMVVALIPVIIVEAIVLYVGFGNSAVQSAAISGAGNLVSTIFGLPVAFHFYGSWVRSDSDEPQPIPESFWGKVVAVFRRVPWIDVEQSIAISSWMDESMEDESPPTTEQDEQFEWDYRVSFNENVLRQKQLWVADWMWVSGTIIVFVVCFVASWVVETIIASQLYAGWSHEYGVLLANLASYALLAGFVVWAACLGESQDVERAEGATLLSPATSPDAQPTVNKNS